MKNELHFWQWRALLCPDPDERISPISDLSGEAPGSTVHHGSAAHLGAASAPAQLTAPPVPVPFPGQEREKPQLVCVERLRGQQGRKEGDMCPQLLQPELQEQWGKLRLGGNEVPEGQLRATRSGSAQR